MYKVSIVIPNYNGLNYLKGCLQSIYQYSTNEVEVIVVDNASSDKSLDGIETLGFGDRLRKISLERNYGFSYAVNTGIKACEAEYVFLLNNDTQIEKNTIFKLLETMENDPALFSCSSKMVQYNDRLRIDDAGNFYTILGWTLKRGNNKEVNRYNKAGLIFSSCAGASIYRKSVFPEIGYFDEVFFAYLEDVDIGFRAKLFGYKNYYNSESIVYHIGSATSGSKYNEFKVRISARNNIYMIYKNMPMIMIFTNFIFILIGIIIKGIFFLRKGYAKVYFQGIIEALFSIQKVHRVGFKWGNVGNYIQTEIEMIFNTLRYFSQLGR